MNRQQVLYLWLAEGAMDTSTIAKAFYDGTKGGQPCQIANRLIKTVLRLSKKVGLCCSLSTLCDSIALNTRHLIYLTSLYL